ncbi:MAG: NADH-quinone oxidoreductase subunit NuoE [Nevskiaceae bacterium]|nr:MAG: NADH-quinone oxidoreductase subunit NuoE [Nevskiaceae bacterium]TBR73927.1 MAG: NADH-quinone oxidoreductase subunit NuoE [Nevskiaceae bacterium]
MSTADPVKLKDLPKVAPFVLHPDDRAAIVHEKTLYDYPRAAVIEALKIVQARHGWVCDAAVTAIADVLGVTAADVDGVATFYNLIFRQPVGRHVIKICDSIGCFLTGYEALRAAFEKHLGIRYGGTTPDNRFTLLPVVCLGACDRGPVIMIDDDTHFNVGPDGIVALLERYA